jgi:NAD(P)H dehydrogenase (quinone)
MEGLMPVKVQIVFYSLYGHVYRLAEAVAEGVRAVPGAEAHLMQVAETLPPEVLEKMGAVEAKKAIAHVPVADPHALTEADAIILGTPTRYGAACAQMQTFLDATGGHWVKGSLIGKVGSAFTSTASQHGGQETTLIHMHTFFYHQGMVVAGVPYAAQELLNLDEITGGTPYGASTIAGPRGERTPTANELAIARFQGRHVAQLAAKLSAR